MRRTVGFPYEPLEQNLFAERIDEFDSPHLRLVDPQLRDKQGLRAKVLAVGPGKALADGTVLPADVKPGDVILIGRATGVELTLADRHVVGLRADDVLAVLEP